ncbi:sigma-54-dependent transcriptional regulator [Tellurirhabdus rosea]|uniref:sigma-54-dependent transcriptional regulator n=1 Tax=Tellurirhabdus rosea TaxID=2674997 RepID=UPI0022549EBC|nr:sigma 54-interacting transcriptional regulator [Tellurirhabdus rosea]
MSTLSIAYELFTRHRNRVVEVLDALEKAGIQRVGRPGSGEPVLLFLDKDTPLTDVQQAIETMAVNSQSPKLLAVTLDNLSMSVNWGLLQAGVGEIICWPQWEKPVHSVLSRLRYWREVDQKVRQLQKLLVGKSKIWLQTLQQLAEMAVSNCPVLLTGESGTGKEIAARQLHELDPRPGKKEYVVVDCTNLIPGLSGSELFGHEKGAFTHAVSHRDGAIAHAHDGTLFLDELGELPLPLQAELLRVLQEGMYKRVGSDVWRRVRFRLISATNRHLAKEVENGTFRQDLFYRVSGWACHLPPLDSRKEDIPLLADHFFRNVYGLKSAVDQQVYDFLMLKNYPGNVRELQQLVGRIASKHLGEGPVTIGDIPRTDWPDFALSSLPPASGDDLTQAIKRLLYQGVNLKDMKDIVTEIAKKEAIDYENGNLKLAAQRLGCSERILQMHRKEEQETSY